MRRLSIHTESWACVRPFRTSNGIRLSADSVVCSLSEGGIIGRGASMPVGYLGEDLHSVSLALQAIRSPLEQGLDRQGLLAALPPGAARNAADAALWDLEAQQNNITVWQALGVRPDPVTTVFSIGLEDDPKQMADKAAAAPQPMLKIKLNADRPLERMQAIRTRRPDARLIVDANQAWHLAQLQEIAPALADLGVELIEQPLPRGADSGLSSYKSPVPLCADESCQHLGELDSLSDGYQFLNIKLEKAGGLTHAWELAAAAKQRGLELMVGCMGGHSLCVTPAHVLAQICRYVDIDGPLLLQADQVDGLIYEAGAARLPAARLWGRRGEN